MPPTDRANRGVTKDPQFRWVPDLLGIQMQDWGRLAADYIAEIGKNPRLHYGGRIEAISTFLRRYLGRYNISDPKHFLTRSNQVDLPPVIGGKKHEVFTDSYSGVTRANYVHDWLAWILENDPRFGSIRDGVLVLRANVSHPFERFKRFGGIRYSETVRQAMPYKMVSDLKQLLAPGPHFSDWKWAQEASILSGKRGVDWFATTDPKLIAMFGAKPGDANYDPDFVIRKKSCIARNRYGSKLWKMKAGIRKPILVERYEVWAPALAVALLMKLELPLRTFQVRMLNSGESDMERIDLCPETKALTDASAEFRWTSNAKRRAELILELVLHQRKRVLKSQGVFQQFSSQFDSAKLTGFYINTNKTADVRKDPDQRGYLVPWQLSELLRWLIKLRNWQEKYNPITRPSLWTELQSKHLSEPLSPARLSLMPPTTFLFRDAAALGSLGVAKDRMLPIPNGKITRLWEKLLVSYEALLVTQKVKDASGEPIRLIKEIHSSSATTFYPLHSLRVSLLTALAFEGKVRSELLMKLAGHSRMIMTLYYLKASAARTHDVLNGAKARMEADQNHNYAIWLKTHSREKLASELVMIDELSAFTILSPQPTQRNSNGWLQLADGWCLAGGNTVPSIEANVTMPGCYNGGKMIRNSPENPGHRIFASVPPRECAASSCRWFVSGPDKLDALVAKLNLVSYEMGQCHETLDKIEEQLHAQSALKYDLELHGGVCDNREHANLNILRERAEARVARSCERFQNVLHLVIRCLELLKRAGSGSARPALVAQGTAEDVRAILQHTNSEMLQVSGICLDAEIYPELKDDAGEAILRRSQILDQRIQREFGKTVLLALDKDTQLKIGNRIVAALAASTAERNKAAARSGSRFEILTLTCAAVQAEQPLPLALRESLKDCLGVHLSPKNSLVSCVSAIR